MSERDDDRRDDLPEHEFRDEGQTGGGGIMSKGGTAVDRGTGTLGGVAQGNVVDDDDHEGDLVDDTDERGAAGRIDAMGAAEVQTGGELRPEV